MRPVIITKDLSMVIYGRDARIGPRSLKNLFTGKSGTTNRSSAVYELAMKSANKAGSPGRFDLEFSFSLSLNRFFASVDSQEFKDANAESLIQAQHM